MIQESKLVPSTSVLECKVIYNTREFYIASRLNEKVEHAPIFSFIPANNAKYMSIVSKTFRIEVEREIFTEITLE